VKSGTHTIGPDNGSLNVKTYRAGMAQKAGHDLVIDVTSWNATVTIDDNSQCTVELTADPKSLRVIDGTGGAKALSDKDREDIKNNIDKKVLKGQAITFRSSGLTLNGAGTVPVNGEVEMGGNTRPVNFQLDVAADGQVKGTVPLVQSEWGIKPYTALMGALKVRDDVEVVLDARLPAGEGPDTPRLSSVMPPWP
jgi:polyisoprenoid-binding protein YceI